MENLKIEINLNDIVEDMFADCKIDSFLGASPKRSFSEEVRDSIIYGISNSIKQQVSKDCTDSIESEVKRVADEFIQSELEGILTRKLRAGEISTRRDGFKSYDELIESALNRVNISSIIERHVEAKAKEFAAEMRARYDNIFAAKVVQGLHSQKMLDPDIAKLLLGENS